MQSVDSSSRARFAPLVAAALGFAAFLYFFDWRLLDPTHIGWVSGADRATNFLGFHFFRHEPWTWPPGLIVNYANAIGASVAITDSVPLAAFVLKPLDGFLPPDFNHLGLWIALSFALQGVFSYHLLRVLGLSVERALPGALLLCLLPFMAARATLHVPLASHWLLTAALWLYLDSVRTPRHFVRWCVLLPVAAMVQPYLFVMVGPVFVACLAALLWKGPAGARRAVATQGAIAIAASVLSLYLLGFFSVSVANTWGQYGQLQMNLLAWFNSLGVGVLIPRLPVSEDGQTDAYMYLGAGGILVLAAGTWQIVRRRPGLAAIHVPLLVAAIGLLALAVSHRVALGPWWLIDLSPLPQTLQDLLNPFRSSGRLAWLPTYLLMAVAIAACASLGSRGFGVLIAAAIALNVVDGGKIRETGQSLVKTSGHRESPDCRALPVSAKRLVLLPQVVLEDLSIAEAWELAVCAGRQGQPMNAGALARTDLSRFETGAREAASWLDRAAAPGIAFAYQNPATGAKLGADPATPRLGSYRVFVPGMAPVPGLASEGDPAWTWPLDVDMSVRGRGRHVLLYGWTVPLGDVRTWSSQAALLLPVPPGLPGGARLSLWARPLPPDAGDLVFEVKANGVALQPLELKSERGPAWYTVRIPAPVIATASGALRIELSTTERAPLVPRRGYPDDRQRLSIERLALRADLPGAVRGRIQGVNPDGAVLGEGWSGPEGWGVWSAAKRVTLRLPLPEKPGRKWNFRFYGHGYAREGRQDVRVVVGSRTLAQWSFPSLSPDEWREVEIPASLVTAGSQELEIAFDIADPASPGGGDPRTLGLALVAYELLAIP
jgi:hypothetical protein